jgi:hypothetical protein
MRKTCGLRLFKEAVNALSIVKVYAFMQRFASLPIYSYVYTRSQLHELHYCLIILIIKKKSYYKKIFRLCIKCIKPDVIRSIFCCL